MQSTDWQRQCRRSGGRPEVGHYLNASVPDHDLSSLYLQTTEVSIKPQGKLQRWGCAGTVVSVVTVEVISSCHQVSLLSTYSYMCSFCQQLSWIWRWIKFRWRRQLNTCKEVNTHVKLYGLEVYILNLLYAKVKGGARDWILYKDDPQLLIYGAPTSGYPVHELIDILLKPGLPPEHICTVQPWVSHKMLRSQLELTAWSLKIWKQMTWDRRRELAQRMYFRVLQSGAVRFTLAKPSSSVAAQYFLLTRRYFVHKTYSKFHRLIADIRGMAKW